MKKDKIATEITLTTTENLVDNILLTTTNSLLSELTKAFPFSGLITGSIEAYTQFRTLKEQKQLLAFIQEAENINKGFIEKFFQDKNNSELGFEILGILNQTYLEHQARMLGRATSLKYNEKISKQEFEKYTYIITKLDSYLISKIEHLFNIYNNNQRENNFAYAPNQPMEFISFGFIERQLVPSFSDVELEKNFKNREFKILEKFLEFYKNIFKD